MSHTAATSNKEGRDEQYNFVICKSRFKSHLKENRNNNNLKKNRNSPLPPVSQKFPETCRPGATLLSSIRLLQSLLPTQTGLSHQP